MALNRQEPRGTPERAFTRITISRAAGKQIREAMSTGNVKQSLGTRRDMWSTGGDTPVEAGPRLPLASSPSLGIYNAIASRDAELKLEHYVDKVSQKPPPSHEEELLLL